MLALAVGWACGEEAKRLDLCHGPHTRCVMLARISRTLAWVGQAAQKERGWPGAGTIHEAVFELSHPVMSSSLGLCGLWRIRLLCPWVLQLRILEWVAISSSRGSSWPRDQTCISCLSLHWKADSLPLSLLGSPSMRRAATKPHHSAAPLPRAPRQRGASPTWWVPGQLTTADVGVQGHRRATRGICSTTELHPLFSRTRTLFPLSIIWPRLSRVILNVYLNTAQCLSCYIYQLQIVVQSLSHVWLFAPPWTAARQAPLPSTISWSLLKFMSIESVTLSNHLIPCHCILLLLSIFPGIRVLSNERSSQQVTKVLELQVGTCHLPLQGLNHRPLQLLTFKAPWKEFRVEISNNALCALGKTARTDLQIGIFRSWFYKPKSCISFYLEKH